MLKRLFARGWVCSGLLCLVLGQLGSLDSSVSADDSSRPDFAATPADGESKAVGALDEAQPREQVPIVQVDDLTTVDSTVPSPYSFLPRKGRFELRVKKGWSGSIPINSHDQGWSNTACQKIGNMPNQRFEAAFASQDPVLEASVFNDVLVLNSVRKGTAAIQFIGGKKNAPAAARCELRIVVEGDTEELKRAVHEASPVSSIRIVEIRDNAVMLLGTVPTSQEITVIMDLARLFYTDVINHLKVAEKAELPREPTRIEPTAPVDTAAKSDRTLQREAKREPGLRRRDRDQLKELRDDIRDLRDDVRRLSELLEKRNGTETRELPESPERPEQPRVPNTIEPAAAIDPAPGKNSVQTPHDAIFFTVPNSELCQKMQPVIAHLQQAGYPILTVDAQARPDIAQRYRVDEFPCFILTGEGHEQFRRSGMIHEAELQTFLDPLILNPSLTLTNEQCTKPLQLAIGVRGELEFPHRIRTARGHDNSIIRLDQIQGSTLKLHAVSRGITILRVSLVGSSDTFDVMVRVDAVNESPNEARRPQKQRIESPQQLAKPVLMLTSGELTIRSDFDVNAIRVMDPTALEVIQENSNLTRLVALKPGLTSIWIKPDGRKLLDTVPIELVVNAIAPTSEAPSSVGPRMQVVTYAVADLLIPIDAEPNFKPKMADWMLLINQIVGPIETEMWDINDGPYAMRIFEETKSLIVRAPWATHQKISELLAEARRKLDVQFTVETTLPTKVDDSFFDRANVKIQFDPKNRVAVLDEVTATLLRDRLQTAASFAPKVTCFDGQIVDIASPLRDGADSAENFRLHMRGKVNPQTREIRMNFTVNPKSPVNELMARAKTIPDGGHLLWDITEEIQRGCPDEPISGRVIVMTCTRVIISSEDEDVRPAQPNQN